jgi:hypothetical protein
MPKVCKNCHCPEEREGVNLFNKRCASCGREARVWGFLPNVVPIFQVPNGSIAVLSTPQGVRQITQVQTTIALQL